MVAPAGGGPLKFDSASPAPATGVFSVSDEPCALWAAGLSPSESIAILREVGGEYHATGFVLSGDPAAVVIQMPGNYKLDLGEYRNRVVVECICPAPDCCCSTTHTQTDLVEDDTGHCIPALFEYNCLSGTRRFIYPHPETKELTMAFNLLPAKSGKRCERYTTEPFILDENNAPAGTTLAGIVQLAYDNDGGAKQYPTFLDVLATDEVMQLVVAMEDEDDVVLLDGQESGGFEWNASDDDATFPGQTPFQVPPGCEATVSVCFRKCLSKAEIAALA